MAPQSVKMFGKLLSLVMFVVLSLVILIDTDDDNLYIVSEVIDGDTIELVDGSKVRYIGVDTPETVKPNTEVECYGTQASEFNKSLVEGKRVRLEKDVSETDRYGRLLRYVYVDDIFVNEYLVKEGYAYAATFQPDVKYQQVFREAENEARENGRGLWGSCEVTLEETDE